MDRRVVHHKDDVFVVEAIERDQLLHVGLEDLRVDGRVKGDAVAPSRVADRADAAHEKRTVLDRSETLLSSGPKHAFRSSQPPNGIRRRTPPEAAVDVRIQLAAPFEPKGLVLLAVRCGPVTDTCVNDSGPM